MPNDSEEPPRRPPRSWADFLAARTTTDVIVLALTFVVAFAILATGATVAIIEIIHPETDTTSITDGLMTIVTGIVGALLGLIAGKNDSSAKPPEP